MKSCVYINLPKILAIVNISCYILYLIPFEIHCHEAMFVLFLL